MDMYKEKIVAVVLAAGKSSRMGGNKIFMNILDKKVIAHSINAFEQSDVIDAVFLVSSEENMYDLRQEIILNGFTKVQNIIRGGETRTESVRNAINFISGFDRIVIHDGARPLVTKEIIEKTIKDSFETGAAITGYKSIDTIKIESDGFVSGTPDRSHVWNVQTPQVFAYELIKRAYESSNTATDDAALVEALGVRVALSEGSSENIKITTPVDLYTAAAILNYRSNL